MTQVGSDLQTFFRRICKKKRKEKKKSQKQQYHTFIFVLLFSKLLMRDAFIYIYYTCIYKHIYPFSQTLPPFLVWSRFMLFGGMTSTRRHQREPTATLTEKAVASSCASQTDQLFNQLSKAAN